MLQSTLSFNYNTAPTLEMNTYIAGVTFENRQNILKSIVSHMRRYGNNKIKFIVVREPNNPYDHNACQVLVKKLNAKNATWMQVGYSPSPTILLPSTISPRYLIPLPHATQW